MKESRSPRNAEVAGTPPSKRVALADISIAVGKKTNSLSSSRIKGKYFGTSVKAPSMKKKKTTSISPHLADKILLEKSLNGGGSVVLPLTNSLSDAHLMEKRAHESGYTWTRDVIMGMGSIGENFGIDRNHEDSHLCGTSSCDIYKHLRQAEMKKRPAVNFMEVVQKDINAGMRATLIDWLVEVAEEYRFVPDTLYLTVNYVDRYLSSNEMNRKRLQLLGVACMLIASKYEEICAPQVEKFCLVTDNTYFREEILQMEADVLKDLKFEMSAATIKSFLRRFVRAAESVNQTTSIEFEFLANYAAELTLVEYKFLCYAPSLVAASAVFLAMFLSNPAKKPWNVTLVHYTLYKPSELYECVKAMHLLLLNSSNGRLPAIHEKYSRNKYKFVAEKHCPPTIPQAFFHD